jgi:ankyrin repeat protein
MQFSAESPFYRLLATKYDVGREDEGLAILEQHPEIARWEWPGPDDKGQPFVTGSTALHYAANDGKRRLVERLIELGADVNAANACWFRSVLAWAANNAHVETIKLLLARGADPSSLDALHAAAWGGSDRGQGREREFRESLQMLLAAGADINDRRHFGNRTPLSVALESGNAAAIELLRSLGASS